MNLSNLFPQACAVVAFVLSILCVLSGYKPGFMENYHVIMLNTSTLGHSMVPAVTSASDSAPAVPSFGSILASFARNKRSSIGDIGSELDGIIGDVTDKLAGALGIKQWYSMHLLNMCEGTYTPSAMAAGARSNVSSCTRPKAMYHFDIAQQLENELEAGKLHLDLSDIGWPGGIQNGLSGLGSLLSALFVLYIVGIATAGLNIVTAPLILLQQSSRLGPLCKGSAAISFLSLLAASIIITFVQLKAVDLINTYGNDIGLYAEAGGKYMVFTWVAVMFMLLGASAEIFGEKIASWNIPRVWSGVYEGHSLEYTKGTYSTRL